MMWLLSAILLCQIAQVVYAVLLRNELRRKPEIVWATPAHNSPVEHHPLAQAENINPHVKR